jgi:hypothetical protein
MIAYACNIECRGCISLSDFPRKGVASLEEITQWTEYWSQYLLPKEITIFGGEPLIHPKLVEVCEVVRLHWPESKIRLITNGYLLDRVDPEVWFKFEPFDLQVSLHRQDHEELLNQQIKKIMLTKRGWEIHKKPDGREHRQTTFVNGKFRIYKSMFKDFVAPYKLDNGNPVPYHSDPMAAHAICGSPACPIIYKGHLYKCPPVANLIDMTNNWSNYQRCEDESTLDDFIKKIGCPEEVCGQCPDRMDLHTYDHFDQNNVIVRKQYVIKANNIN